MRWLKPRRTVEGITEGSIVRAIAALTGPMLIGAVLQNLQSLIDLFWVGRLGPTAVASVAMSGTILMVLFPMLMGLSTGTLALVARAVGAGNIDDASKAASQSIFLAVVLGVLTGLVGWHYSEAMFRLMRAAPDVLEAGESYLRISLLGSFTIFVLFIGSAALQGAGDTLTPTYVMAGSNVLNIVLNPLLIFGVGPFPRLGVAGSALATLIAQTVAALAVVHILFSGRAHLHVKISEWRPDFALSWRILRIGIPGSGQMLSRSLMNAAMMWIVASCGTAAVAAYGTGFRFHMIILMPAFALGGAAATMVGQNLGAGKPDRAHRAAWIATLLDVGFMAVAGVILMLFAAPLMGFFNHDADVIEIGARYLRIVSPFYLFAALGIVHGRALNGAGDSMAPMIITVVSLWGLQVPLALFLARIWQPATHGIWWAMGLAMMVNGLMMGAWFELGRWRHKKV